MLWSFMRSISSRLKVVTDNAAHLAAGTPLATPLDGSDEIAQLDRVLHRTAIALGGAEAERERLLESERAARAEANAGRSRTSSSRRCRTSCARRSTRSSAGRSCSRAQPRDAEDVAEGAGRRHRAQRPRAGAAHRRPARHEPHHLRQAAARRAARRSRRRHRGGARRACARRPRRRAFGSRTRAATRTPGRCRGDSDAAAAGRLEPAVQRHQVHAARRARRRSALQRVGVARRDRASPTPARASPPSSCRTCSSASARPTARRTRRHGGLGLGLGDRQAARRAARRRRCAPRARARAAARRSSVDAAAAPAAQAAPARRAAASAARSCRRRDAQCPRPRPACACSSSTTSPTRASSLMPRLLESHGAEVDRGRARRPRRCALVEQRPARRAGQRHRHAAKGRLRADPRRPRCRRTTAGRRRRSR